MNLPLAAGEATVRSRRPRSGAWSRGRAPQPPRWPPRPGSTGSPGSRPRPCSTTARTDWTAGPRRIPSRSRTGSRPGECPVAEIVDRGGGVALGRFPQGAGGLVLTVALGVVGVVHDGHAGRGGDFRTVLRCDPPAFVSFAPVLGESLDRLVQIGLVVADEAVQGGGLPDLAAGSRLVLAAGAAEPDDAPHAARHEQQGEDRQGRHRRDGTAAVLPGGRWPRGRRRVPGVLSAGGVLGGSAPLTALLGPFRVGRRTIGRSGRSVRRATRGWLGH